MDSQKGGHDGVQEIDTNLLVVIESGTRLMDGKMLAGEFAGNLAVANFGVRSAGLQAAARETGHTSEISATRRIGIYIGLGFGNFLEFLNFRIILIPRIKIILKNLEIVQSSEKSSEKS
jgi:hypothetical protein